MKRYFCFIVYIVFCCSFCCSKFGIVIEIGGDNEIGSFVLYGDFFLWDVL